jgi:gliding motility-associated-like protein
MNQQMVKYKNLIALAALALVHGTVQGQLTVSTSLTPQQLVEEVLLGSGVTATNVMYNGQLNAQAGLPGIGSFVSVGTNLGLDAGVVLAAGNVANIPNMASVLMSDFNGTGSDPDLVQLSNQNINDKAVLEFDFVPTGDTLRFKFVFASEEYNEYVCSSFNDAFGFFLSGPGINGPFSNNAVNLAVVPNTNIPITINTVNSGVAGQNGNPSTCAAADPNWQSNSIYYFDNTGGAHIVYDGFTTVLTAFRLVECGQTYHIKLAVGDGGDSALDSGVFLEAGSFTSSPFIPSLSPGPGIVGTNTILESCYSVQIDFTRTGDTTLASVVYINVTGTATPGVDYLPPFPDSLVFAPGVSTIPFILNAPIDPDGPETIILELTSFATCAGASVTNIFTFIIDSPPPLAATGFDLNVQCGEDVLLTPSITGGFAPYQIQWGGAGTGSSITVSPLGPTIYTATVTDTCGSVVSALFNIGLVELPPLSMSIIGSSTLVEGCETAQISISRPQGIPGDLTIELSFMGEAQNGSDFQLPGSVVIGAGNPTVVFPFVPIDDQVGEGNESVMVIGTFTDDCGRSVDASVTFTIVDAPDIVLEGNNYMVDCEEADSLLLSVNAYGGFNNQLTITWGIIGEPTGSSVWIPVINSQNYIVTATDPCGRTATTGVSVVVDCEIIIPNVFSPNNDGVNDVWEIEGIIYTSNTVKVFNRWGNLIYETRNYRNTWKANDVPDGTYFYEITVERHEKPYTGHVTILRNSW